MTPEQELLVLAYWWDFGIRHQAPEWVCKHALWPENNDRFHLETAQTPQPGRERLWEAINIAFQLKLK